MEFATTIRLFAYVDGIEILYMQTHESDPIADLLPSLTEVWGNVLPKTQKK